MPAEQHNFYVTHPTRGNLLWHGDGTPVYFATAEQAQATLDGFVRDSRAEFDGFYVAEYGLTPAQRHYEQRCQSLHHAR